MDLLILKCPNCKAYVRYYDRDKNQLELEPIKYKCTKCGSFIIKSKSTIHNIIVHSDTEKMTKIEGTLPLEVAEGKYTGKIESEEVRNTVFNGKTVQYNDFVVSLDGVTKPDGTPMTIKVGFSFNMSPKSTLGSLYQTLTGKEIKEGTIYDTAELVGKRISFLVMNEKKENGTFATIVKKSITLVKG